MTTDKSEAIARLPIFAGLPKPLQAQLVEISGLQRISQGSVLFGENERCHYVYGLVSGTLALVTSDGGADSIIDFVDCGELVLMPTALLDQPYMASGIATSDVLALLIPAASFRELVAENAELATRVARALALQWRQLLNQMKKLKIGDADMRLAQYLLEHVGPTAPSFHLPGSKRQLAAHLGMTPATLSRSFKRLGDLGVTTSGSSIRVASLRNLASFVKGADHPQPASATHDQSPVRSSPLRGDA